MTCIVGVDRKWLQGHPTLSRHDARPPKVDWVHFDVCMQRKARAIALGAKLTDRYGSLEHVYRLRGYTVGLDLIAQCRARRAQA